MNATPALAATAWLHRAGPARVGRDRVAARGCSGLVLHGCRAPEEDNPAVVLVAHGVQ